MSKKEIITYLEIRLDYLEREKCNNEAEEFANEVKQNEIMRTLCKIQNIETAVL